MNSLVTLLLFLVAIILSFAPCILSVGLDINWYKGKNVLAFKAHLQ